MTHLRDFDRIELERLRRIQGCLQADRPTEREVTATLRRWERGRSRVTRRTPARVAWAVALTLLLTAGAMAASRRLKFSAWTALPAHSTATAPVASSSVPRARSFFVERAGRRVEYHRPAEFMLLAGEQVSLIVGDAHTELIGPGLAQVEASATAPGWVAKFVPRSVAPALSRPPPIAPGPRKLERVPGISRSTPSATPSQSPPDSNPGSLPNVAPEGSEAAWARAASALRRGDPVSASSALSELGHSADPQTRDAALLARAQLDLAAAHGDRAQPVLEALARTGATPFVRERARQILADQK